MVRVPLDRRRPILENRIDHRLKRIQLQLFAVLGVS